MLILTALAVLFVSGVLLARYGGYDWDALGAATAIISGLFLLLAVGLIPMNRMAAYAHIAEIRSYEATAAAARTDGDGLEGAAFRLKIADANAWIASAQYTRGTVFAIWWPAEIDTLQPIR